MTKLSFRRFGIPNSGKLEMENALRANVRTGGKGAKKPLEVPEDPEQMTETGPACFIQGAKQLALQLRPERISLRLRERPTVGEHPAKILCRFARGFFRWIETVLERA